MVKTALVTGASSGIGRAVAIKLAQDGFRVLVHYNSNLPGAEATLAEIKTLTEMKTSGEVKTRGEGHKILQFNLKDQAQIEERLKGESIHCLVNNAGIHSDGMALLMGMETFEKVFDANVFGTFLVTQVCAKKMQRDRAGVIVNMVSISGQTGNPGQVNYSASKAALIAMTKTLAMELGPRGVRVNAVAPGLVETDMIKAIPHLEEIKKRIPLGRFGSVAEVAACVSFLCSPGAAYVTGHTLSVNGGLYCS